jgi:hypothetical protein
MPNQFLAGRSWFEVVVPISKTDRPATLSVPWKGSFASERHISEEIVGKRVNTYVLLTHRRTALIMYDVCDNSQ